MPSYTWSARLCTYLSLPRSVKYPSGPVFIPCQPGSRCHSRSTRRRSPLARSTPRRSTSRTGRSDSLPPQSIKNYFKKLIILHFFRKSISSLFSSVSQFLFISRTMFILIYQEYRGGFSYLCKSWLQIIEHWRKTDFYAEIETYPFKIWMAYLILGTHSAKLQQSLAPVGEQNEASVKWFLMEFYWFSNRNFCYASLFITQYQLL